METQWKLSFEFAAWPETTAFGHILEFDQVNKKDGEEDEFNTPIFALSPKGKKQRPLNTKN